MQVNADQLQQGDVFLHAGVGLIVANLSIGVNGVVAVRYRTVDGARTGRMMLSRDVEVSVTYRHDPEPTDEQVEAESASWRALAACASVRVINGEHQIVVHDNNLGQRLLKALGVALQGEAPCQLETSSVSAF